MTREMHRDPIVVNELDASLRGFLDYFIPRYGAPPTANHLIHSHLILDPNGKCFDPDDDKYVDHVAIGPRGALPDPRSSKTDWTEEAWKKRTILCYAGYHCLVTLAKGDGLEPDPWSDGRFSGAMYFMKYSKTTNKDGIHFYENVLQRETKEDFEKLMYELDEAVASGFQAAEESFKRNVK